MRLKLPKKLTECFSSYKYKFNLSGLSALGKMWWQKPDDVIWLYSTDNEEGYEGSQTQFGILKDGTVVWGFFSHCSCFGYEAYDGKHKEFNGTDEDYKQYELEKVPKDVLDILKQKIKDMIRIGIKEKAI